MLWVIQSESTAQAALEITDSPRVFFFPPLEFYVWWWCLLFQREPPSPGDVLIKCVRGRGDARSEQWTGEALPVSWLMVALGQGGAAETWLKSLVSGDQYIAFGFVFACLEKK